MLTFRDFLFILWLFFFNLGMFMTLKVASALQMVVLNLLVSPCVWLLDLILNYTGQHSASAEAWSNWSWLQLGGYCFVVAGQLVFQRGAAPQNAASLQADAEPGFVRLNS